MSAAAASAATGRMARSRAVVARLLGRRARTTGVHGGRRRAAVRALTARVPLSNSNSLTRRGRYGSDIAQGHAPTRESLRRSGRRRGVGERVVRTELPRRLWLGGEDRSVRLRSRRMLRQNRAVDFVGVVALIRGIVLRTAMRRKRRRDHRRPIKARLRRRCADVLWRQRCGERELRGVPRQVVSAGQGTSVRDDGRIVGAREDRTAMRRVGPVRTTGVVVSIGRLARVRRRSVAAVALPVSPALHRDVARVESAFLGAVVVPGAGFFAFDLSRLAPRKVVHVQVCVERQDKVPDWQREQLCRETGRSIETSQGAHIGKRLT